MNTPGWGPGWALKGAASRQILISVTDAVTLNDSPTRQPLWGVTPPLKQRWFNKKDARWVLLDRVSRLCLPTLTFCAPKSIRAVRPLNQLKTSSPPLLLPSQTPHSFFFPPPEATYIVQFKVKAAGVAHRISVPVAPPKGGGGGLAVCTAGACTSSSGLKEAGKMHHKYQTRSLVEGRSAQAHHSRFRLNH